MKRKIINLGILAHVDAGKTTLTEQMLFNSGKIRLAGNVDKGTSHSDILDVEKERGISVRAASVSFCWNGVQINLIDTPGHIDFSAEVARSLRVVDCTVLVVSAVEGVQAQTETIWQALHERRIPVIIFVNKIDRIGADTKSVFTAIKNELSNDAVLLNVPVREAENDAAIADGFHPKNDALVAAIAEKDDALLEKYLNEETIALAELQNRLRTNSIAANLYPVVCGVAKNNLGVTELLDLITEYLPQAGTDIDAPTSGIVYKIEHDPKLGRMAGVRLFAGKLNKRDIVHNHTANREEKVTQIKKYFTDRFEDIDQLEAGDIGFICGMPEAMIGDILGDPAKVPDNYSLVEPLLTAEVTPENKEDYSDLAAALQVLDSEDPHLNFVWYKDVQKLQVNIMGKIQIEILTGILKNRFGIEAEFAAPSVIYKETPSGKGIGFESYTMPKPCWAVVKFEIEPGARGSGIIYKSIVSENKIHQKYQNEIEIILSEALQQGMKGWNVTDLKVTLVDGEHHNIHSRPGDFKLATFMGIMKGLHATGTDLLEPMISFKIIAPEEYLGKVTNDIITMRGSFEPAEVNNGRFRLRGTYPLATSLEYFVRLNSLTGGKAKLKTRFAGYQNCPAELGETREYQGVHPLDRSKFILKWRGALA